MSELHLPLSNATPAAPASPLGNLLDGARPLNAALDRIDNAAGSLAQRGAAAVHDGVATMRERSTQMRQQAVHASDMALDRVRAEPLKSVLIAAAAGAGMMAVIGWLARRKA